MALDTLIDIVNSYGKLNERIQHKSLVCLSLGVAGGGGALAENSSGLRINVYIKKCS